MKRLIRTMVLAVVGSSIAAVVLAGVGPGSPNFVVDHPGTPNLTPWTIGADADNVVFSGEFGYSISAIANDNAFIDRFKMPNSYIRALDRMELGILFGPRGTRGLAICFDIRPEPSRFVVTDTSLNQVSVWKNEFPSAKAGDKRVATIPDIDTPQAVRCEGNNIYVTSGTDRTNAQLVQIVKGEGDTYKLEKRLELGACDNPRAMALAGGAAYVACDKNNTVVKVNLAELKVVATVQTHQPGPEPGTGLQGSTPYDIAARVAGDNTSVYTVNLASDTLSVIKDDGTELKLMAALPVTPRTNPFSAPAYIEVSPDGRFVHTSNFGDKSISTFCAATNKLIATWLAVDPDVTFRPAEVIAQGPSNQLLYVHEGGTRLLPYSLANFYIGSCPP